MRGFRINRRRTATSVAASISIITAGLVAATPAHAADDQGWACEVMLCASNPGGWMEFAECVPPIQKLITHLALGGSFPICVGGGMAEAKYTKPRHGNPASVVFTMQDGSKVRYTVPNQAQIDAAPQTPTTYQQ
jgi:hypothetical protein